MHLPDDLLGDPLARHSAFRLVNLRISLLRLLYWAKVTNAVGRSLRLRRARLEIERWNSTLGQDCASSATLLAPLGGPLYPDRDSQSIERARLQSVAPNTVGSIHPRPALKRHPLAKSCNIFAQLGCSQSYVKG